MKLIFRQYLASLRERRELDAVLPDLISELGYTVVSRPSIGTRQFGVDVSALGPAVEGGEQKFYLFSIKQGDLTREDWDGNPQALRSSLNEILDVYIPTFIPQEHRHRPVVICLCFGGAIVEAVRANVTRFISAHTNTQISFEEWNGDKIAGLLVDGVLREQLLAKALRTHFQKSVAMVDEPDVSYTHFSALIDGVCSQANATLRQRITALRQIYICLWVLFVWARDIGNLEAPFRIGELALLRAWSLARHDVGRSGRAAEEIGIALAELASLNNEIWDSLIAEKILPHASAKHAVSLAVRSPSSVDVNRKLFETLGRIAFRGLCQLWSVSADDHLPRARSDWRLANVDSIAQSIVDLIRNNPILMTPFADDQSIDIATALLFLSMIEDTKEAAKKYIEAIARRTVFAYRTHGRYPTIYGDYRSMIEHPRGRDEDYRKRHTQGSTLYPLLALWGSSVGAKEAAEHLSKFAAEEMQHCSMQLWFVGSDTEDKLYIGDTDHGASLNGVPITPDGCAAFSMLEAECNSSDFFSELSAIKHRHWPIVVLACRHYRLPLPPNLWIGLLRQPRESAPAREAN